MRDYCDIEDRPGTYVPLIYGRKKDALGNPVVKTLSLIGFSNDFYS
jgi:hypothetical protein